jgi:hypothetical protein
MVMAEAYVPELGQMVFGQPSKQYQVPDLMEAVLGLLQYRLRTVQWNIHQEELPDPFSNSGGQFLSETFCVEAYDWDEDREQPWNFKWKDLEISWYKYMGRGMSANMEITPRLCDECLKDCLAALEQMDPA